MTLPVAFDGTTLQPHRTGVGYYSEHLLRHLAKDPGLALTVVSNRRPDLVPWPDDVALRVRGQRLVRVAWMQTVAPAMLRESGVALVHCTNSMIPLASPVPTVVTIHDMSLELHAETHPWRRRWLNRPLTRAAAERASAIITLSHSSKRDIVHMLDVAPSRVHVVHLAAAPHFSPVTDPARLAQVRETYRLPDRFLLCVGAIEPRKNLARLFEAIAARRHDGVPPCVVVGPYGWRSRGLGDHIERLGLTDRVHFVGYVPMADLPAVYSLAETLVFPSIYEGFGLPILEAMACGTPVITGDHDSLVEVAADAALRVHAMDVGAIGDGLVAMARREDLRAHYAQAGPVRAAEFSWTRAAQETRAVYDAVVSAPATTSVPTSSQPIIVPGTPLVLIGQGYHLRFDPKLWRAQQPYPPLGALYAAAAVRQAGVSVAVCDSMLAEHEQAWADALDRTRPTLAVIYEDNFNYLTKMCLLRMRQAAVTMIGMARERGVPVVVAGSDATDHPEVYLEAGAEAVILGEGEITLVEWVRARLEGRSIEGLAGLCHRDGDGGLCRHVPRLPMRDLSTLPRPAWDLVDLEQYRAIWQRAHGYFSLPLSTTRGCPYHCNWCAKPLYGQRYSVRPPDAVAAEIEWLQRTWAPDHLWMTDDIFGLVPGWVSEFADALERRGVSVPFKCLMRADQVTADVAAALQRAGATTVWIGAESGSQRILDAMDKGVTVAQIEEATRALKSAGLRVGFFLQFGYPGEGLADIAQTIGLVRRCRPDDIGISVSYPLPGTLFHERVRAELGAKQNWVDSSDLTPMYRAPFSDAFYRVLHQAVHAEFRLQRVSELRPLWRRPWRVRPDHLRTAAAAAKYAGLLPALRWRLWRLSSEGRAS